MAAQRGLRELATSPRAMRSPSLSSDVPSTRSAAAPALPEANPPPSFVASAEASQLVSAELDESVSVKEQALLLLNSFLDHILYNILSTAKSIQLGRLRNAVPIVLKPRLGKAALGAADEELKEYLNDGDDELLAGSDLRPETGNNFDLELAWKLARLRCMVYTRLGDMEEEDEEEYIEAEQLHLGSGAYTNATHRVSSVKAASAIFLTSILEYLGEQALLYAVQNTQRRTQATNSPVALQLGENGPMSPPIHQRMVLDESDMFYVGRESPLSRLWRSWRRQIRLPMETTSRQISPIQDEYSPMAERAPRIDENIAQEEIQDSGLPHQVPLPISDNDVNEIEVPGLAREIVDDGDTQPAIPVPERSKKRPVSMVTNDYDAAYQHSPESPRTMTVQQKRRSRPYQGHKRSISHPTPEKQTFPKMPSAGIRDVSSWAGAQGAEDASPQQPTSDAKTEAASAGFVEQPEEKEEPKEGHAATGLVASAVSAAAGALGLGALALGANSKEEELAELQTKPVRTAADEMIGTTLQVAPSTDAITGSSITSAGDFDNLHLPVEKPKMSENHEINSRLDSSDPEDLALSSGDEDTSERQPKMPVNNSMPPRTEDSSYNSALPPKSTASRSTAPAAAMLDDPSPVLKTTNRQGMIFIPSHDGSKRDASVANPEEPNPSMYAPVDKTATNDVSSNHHLVATPATLPLTSTETAMNRSPVSPAYVQSDRGIVREPVGSRPTTATTTMHSSVPPRLSSERSGSGNIHTDSRTSRYSQDSKRSSSSSKLLGFTRDYDGRPQTGTYQDPLTNGTHDHTTGNPETSRDQPSNDSSLAGKPLKIETKAGLEKGIDEAEAKKKSLEILIRGDETLHYTLTPVSARAEQVSAIVC